MIGSGRRRVFPRRRLPSIRAFTCDTGTKTGVITRAAISAVRLQINAAIRRSAIRITRRRTSASAARTHRPWLHRTIHGLEAFDASAFGYVANRIGRQTIGIRYTAARIATAAARARRSLAATRSAGARAGRRTARRAHATGRSVGKIDDVGATTAKQHERCRHSDEPANKNPSKSLHAHGLQAQKRRTYDKWRTTISESSTFVAVVR